MADITDIFEQIVRPQDGGFSPELAQYVLTITFTAEQIGRYEALADRVQDDKLSAAEKDELDAFVQANSILTVLRAKARRSLSQSTSAA
jgi:hypothetical protein